MDTYCSVLKPFAEKREFMDARVSSGIEANRKGSVVLNFVNEAGDPIPVDHVKITQQTHDFRYGANLFMLDEFDHAEQNAAYKKYYADAFNIATLPFYWDTLEPEQGKPRYAKDSPKIYRRPAPDLCLEYCEKYGIEPKAHCLNYESFSPAWLDRHDSRAMKFFLEKRFRELSERYAARIPRWEVTNETFWGGERRSFYLDPEFVEWSFKTAERYFPSNVLTINESNCRIWDSTHFYFTRSPYYMQIERALLKGARIDAVGMQFHMFYRAERAAADTAEFYDPERLYQVMDTYALLGRPMHITELTLPAYAYTQENEEVQAEIIRNLYSIWFSHPAMDAIIYWNLVDGFAAFAPQGDMTAGENYYHGGLIRNDFTPKPAYYAVQELFGKVWRTNIEKNPQGATSAEFRGFYGEYQVEAISGDRAFTAKYHLRKDNPYVSQNLILKEQTK